MKTAMASLLVLMGDTKINKGQSWQPLWGWHHFSSDYFHMWFPFAAKHMDLGFFLFYFLNKYLPWRECEGLLYLNSCFNAVKGKESLVLKARGLNRPSPLTQCLTNSCLIYLAVLCIAWTINFSYPQIPLVSNKPPRPLCSTLNRKQTQTVKRLFRFLWEAVVCLQLNV